VPLVSGEIEERRPRQKFDKLLRGAIEKLVGYRLEDSAIRCSHNVLKDPIHALRATALAFAVSSHQFIDVAPINIEGFTLSTGARLSRKDPRLYNIYKAVVSIVDSKIG
jgi:hypothetical protein